MAIWTRHQRRYILGAGAIGLPYLVICYLITPYRNWLQNRDMAKEFKRRGYPWTLEEVPTLTGGYGDPKEQLRRYEEAKKQGINLTTWEVDYIAIKDKMIAGKIAEQQEQRIHKEEQHE